MKNMRIFTCLIVTATCLLPSCYRDLIPLGEYTGEVVDGLGGNTIKFFLSDGDHNIWMASNSSSYLFKTDGKNIIRYGHSENDPGSLSSNRINDGIVDNDGMVWFASQKGVDRYNSTRGCFEHPTIDDINKYVLSITCAPNGRICIATRRNILEYDPASDIFVKKIENPFLVNSVSEPELFFDSGGKLWIQNNQRIDCYDEEFKLIFSKDLGKIEGHVVYDGLHSVWMIVEGRLMLFDTKNFVLTQADSMFHELGSLKPTSLSCVDEGLILIRCAEESICVDDIRGVVYREETSSGNLKKMLQCSDAGALSIVYHPSGGLFVAPAEGGFHYFPSQSAAEKPYSELIDVLSCSTVKDYIQDSKYFWFLVGNVIFCYDISAGDFVGSLDLSTYYTLFPCNLSIQDEGKILLSGAPRRNDPGIVIDVGHNGTIRVCETFPNPRNGMMAFAGNSDVILASTGAKIYRINPKKDFKKLDCPFVDNACYVSLIKTLHTGSVLICYTDHAPILYNPQLDEMEELNIDNIKQIYFSLATEDSHGNIWLGSTDNGLFMYSFKTKQMKRISTFPELQVESLAADNTGNVFAMDVYNNVYLYNSETDEVRRVWTDVSSYPPACMLFTLPDSDVALIGSNDFRLFNEDHLSSDDDLDIQARVILTSGKNVITSFNTSSYPSGEAVVHLKRNIEGLNLHLGPIWSGSTDLAASYSYMYLINSLSAVPRESFDNAFIPLYGVSKAKNRLKFWIKNNNTGAESKPFTLLIRMNYLWFEIAIPLLIAAFCLLCIVMLDAFYRKKREADSERIKREMTERVNLENIDFFANISHEFRTPLTLIHGAVLSLESNNPSDITKAHGVIKRNTSRLLKLVSQMLDFNKLDHGMLKLNVKLEPICEIFEETKMNFEIGASVKDIDLTLNLPECPIMGWVDRDKIEKMLYNLCSNALKYTPPGGSVTIDVSEDKNHFLYVSVSDTGIGIQEEDIDVIFDRFYQTEASKKSGGTGIGLYLTKAMVTLHHGSIGVAVRKNENNKTTNTVFSFSLPIGKEEYSEAEMSEATDMVTSIDSREMMSEYMVENISLKSTQKKQKLLIIDDDYEMVYYLKSLFSDIYSVYFRFDAISGYKKIEDICPDVIICDVMMVDVDGIQLCRMVKENSSMSYIPFIMLTAKSTMEDQIKSLGIGADAYVVKPFNSEYLLALVKSMVENRMRVKAMLGSSITVPPFTNDSLSCQDRIFMENLYSQMEASLKNGEMDIDSMAEALCVSRSKLYYKVKGLTGQTPNDFFTTYKLNYSVKLIKEGKYKIAAIAEMLGYSSASHFSSLFKKQFGGLPSQFSKMNQ